jgi:hypothetical protein
MTTANAHGLSAEPNAGDNSSPLSIQAFREIGQAAPLSSALTSTPQPNCETSSGQSGTAASSAPRKGLRSRQRAGEPSESASQAAVIQWANLACRTFPELRWIHAIPNGAFLGRDRQAAAMHAAKLKATGLKPGVCDLFLPAARSGMHGLYIEMKKRGQQATPEQIEFMAYARGQGYRCCVCYAAEEAIAEIRRYLMALP